MKTFIAWPGTERVQVIEPALQNTYHRLYSVLYSVYVFAFNCMEFTVIHPFSPHHNKDWAEDKKNLNPRSMPTRTHEPLRYKYTTELGSYRV
jgi:hypothetical protein